tara:strand:- start:792 stop:1385 length:594 start_codon:yes stop_codon:yes gene_type:complete
VKSKQQMGYKYKLKEFEVGDVKVDNGTKSTVTDINPTTGAISWSISQIPNIDRLLDESDALVNTAKGVYQKVKDDKVFLDIYKQARSLRNIIRTHTRNNYPEEYKKSRGVNEDEIDEMSTSGAAGAYLTKNAFKKPKKQKALESAEQPGEDLGPGPKATENGVNDNAYVKQFKYKLVPKNNGTFVQKGSGLEVKKLY